MKFQFIGNACGIFEGSEGSRILCDPWIKDGVFDGSWYHYPPLKTTQDDFRAIDAIYISHLHQDHFDERTFDFPVDLPIIVLDWGPNFLERKLRTLGYHNLIMVKPKNITSFNEFEFTLFEPFAKHVFFEANVGNLIDSALLIRDVGTGVVALNANDNTLTEKAAAMVRSTFGRIDLAMLNYNSAGPYPSCFSNLSDLDKSRECSRNLEKNFDLITKVLPILEASIFLPFAGSYVLGGHLARKNKYLGTTTWDKCALEVSSRLESDTKIVCMREGQTLDIPSACLDSEYAAIDESHMRSYIEYISGHSYWFELLPQPSVESIIEKLESAHSKMQDRWTKLSLTVSMPVYIKIGYRYIQVTEQFAILDHNSLPDSRMICELDLRLLDAILEKQSHWNNAEIGCHIDFDRRPNVYEPDLHMGLQFLHL